MTLDDRIKELCEKRGYHFKPWEIAPWNAHEGPSPYPPGTAGSNSWPKAQALRRQLIKELEQAHSHEERA